MMACGVLLGILLCASLSLSQHISVPPSFVNNKFDRLNLKFTGKNTTAWETIQTGTERVMERAVVEVPLDNFKSKKRGSAGFKLSILRLRGKEAPSNNNILVNPGGPGLGGTQMIQQQGEEMIRIVGEGYNLVGFDPRGVGNSTPAVECLPEATVGFLEYFLSPDYEELSKQAEIFATSCSKSTGKAAKYINTPQTAADMNLILDVLGQQKLNFWGFSYGSVLGQTYAMMFPDRAGRIVLDSISDVSQWYSAKYQETRYNDSDTVFDASLGDCIRLGSLCPLTQFASTKEQLKKVILDFGKRLTVEPKNSSGRYNLTYNKLIMWLFSSLSSRAKWMETTRQLSQFLAKSYNEGPLSHESPEMTTSWALNAFIFIFCNDGLSGRDHYPKSSQKLHEEMTPYINNSLFSRHSVPLYYAKQKWPHPKTHNFKANTSVETATPILLMSNSLDPLTPIGSAKAARSIFKDSRLIQLTTFGHSAMSMKSQCAEEHLRNYWKHGVLPATDVLCAAEHR